MRGDAEGNEVMRLCLICLAPPEEREGAATEFGLQDKRQALHGGQRQADGAMRYEFDVQVAWEGGAAAPRFRGPFVHGTAALPFVYLGWREQGPKESPWIRRLKVPLSGITSEQVETVTRRSGGVLEAAISGAGSGTVPLIGGGWTPRAASDAGTDAATDKPIAMGELVGQQGKAS